MTLLFIIAKFSKQSNDISVCKCKCKQEVVVHILSKFEIHRRIGGPRHLEHFVSLWNTSRDLHERSFAREVGSRKVRLSNIVSGPRVPHRSFHMAFIEASKCIHLDVSLSQCSAILLRLLLLRLGFWKNFRSTPTSCNFQTFSKFLEHFQQRAWEPWMNKQILQLVLNLPALKLY